MRIRLLAQSCNNSLSCKRKGIVQVASFLCAPITPWARRAWVLADADSTQMLSTLLSEESVATVTSAIDSAGLAEAIAQRVYEQHPLVHDGQVSLAEKLSMVPRALQQAVLRHHMRWAQQQPLLPITVCSFCPTVSFRTRFHSCVQSGTPEPCHKPVSPAERKSVPPLQHSSSVRTSQTVCCPTSTLAHALRSMQAPVALALQLDAHLGDMPAAQQATVQLLTALGDHAQVHELQVTTEVDSAKDRTGRYVTTPSAHEVWADVAAVQSLLTALTDLQRLDLQWDVNDTLCFLMFRHLPPVPF